MSVMCTLEACKAMQGMCAHEKIMLVVGLLVLGSGAAYLLL